MAEERLATEAKRLALSEEAAAEVLRRETARMDADEHRRAVYAQTIFPAQQAEKMRSFIVTLHAKDLKKFEEEIRVLSEKNVFRKWVTLKTIDPFDKVTHNYGSISNINDRFATQKARQAKCSPSLAAWIHHHTPYRPGNFGPDPQSALEHLLRACFINSHLMFKESWSAYRILLQGDLVIDKAFVLACIYATKWLGILLLPVGSITQWPPMCPEVDGPLII